MTTTQGFPNLDTPITDDNGMLSLVWFRFFIALWNRTGASVGNNSANFLYPNTVGNQGQVLTSEGAATPTIWTTLLTKLSQFTNDAGFITAQSLVGLSTPASTNTQITEFVYDDLSVALPAPDSASGSPGSSTRISREDHSHPTEHRPVFQAIGVGAVTWQAGTGAPSGVQPNASLYSRTDGATGSRLYVSNGATWSAVAGV